MGRSSAKHSGLHLFGSKAVPICNPFWLDRGLLGELHSSMAAPVLEGTALPPHIYATRSQSSVCLNLSLHRTPKGENQSAKKYQKILWHGHIYNFVPRYICYWGNELWGQESLDICSHYKNAWIFVFSSPKYCAITWPKPGEKSLGLWTWKIWTQIK